MKPFIHSLKEGSKSLFITGLGHLMLTGIFILMCLIDSRTVGGESIWLKPLRFAISIWLFSWTFAWFSQWIKKNRKLIQTLNILIAISMWIEIALISTQSVRGVGSHFNFETPLDATIFSIMGGVIGFNAIVLLIWVIVFSFFEKKAGQEYRTSILYALWIFLLGNLSGYLIIRYGWPEGLYGEMADPDFQSRQIKNAALRFSHAFGLHVIQILPLAMWFSLKCNIRKIFIHLIAFIYLLLWVLIVVFSLDFLTLS